jgi:ELWxxDGT repeat protein
MSGRLARIALALAIAGLTTGGVTVVAAAAPGDPVVTQVADINPGPGDSNSSDFVVVGSKAYFAASDGSHGVQLWQTNGGPLGSGTSQEVINPSGDANPYPRVDAGGTLFFAADDGVHGTELWKEVPGTPAQMVANINANGDASGSDSSDPSDLVAMGGSVFFVADDGDHGSEIWKSDGTTTTRVSNFSGSGPNSFGADLTVLGDKVFFSASEGTDGAELWMVAPPYTSATQVANINPSATEGSNPQDFAVVNGQLFFTAAASGTNFELWKSEPPFTSAVLVREINTGGVGGSACSCPHELVGIGNTLFFTASGGGPTEVWKSEPPYDSASTNQVTSIGGINDPENLTVGDGTLYFTDDPTAFGTELFKTTGTGATRISDINPGGESSDPDELAFINGKLYFEATEPDHGAEPYVYDGTSVSRLADIDPGPDSSFPGNFAGLGSTVLFSANDGSSGFEPWKVFPEAAPPGGGGPPGTQPIPPTGKRAKALKKCKKKKSKKARKKCRKKAKKLPV